VRVLVTGGAGYVGSVTVEQLLAAGHQVTVLDSLVRGHRAAVPDDATLVTAGLHDTAAVETALRDNGIEAVLHCAAYALVGESMADPQIYYRENVIGGLSLLTAMRSAGVGRIVLSSTAATYGVPESTPIAEDHPTRPINPYGATKLAFEGALQWYATAYGMAAMALRYFNACGASDEHGEDHDPETHLIPNILRGALGGPAVKIFGTDYETPDGTCIRDYIHVLDLADAHIAALTMTAQTPGEFVACNLGSGSGFSVLDVVRAAESVVGRSIPHEFGPRRPGDPPVLVASNAKARDLLGWTPRRGTLAEMIGSAWRWHDAHPGGYSS
jgi:UDP-glucose 4-epimerase